MVPRKLVVPVSVSLVEELKVPVIELAVELVRATSVLVVVLLRVSVWSLWTSVVVLVLVP